jgi:phosphatidate cytidylyltransferase
MLKQRISTAVLLLLIFLPALFSPGAESLGIIGLVLILAAAWEWGRLNDLGFTKAFLLSIICFVLCVSLWILGIAGKQAEIFWLLIAILWVFISFYFFKNGIEGWKKIHIIIRNSMGVLLLTSAGLALFQAKLIGTSFLTSVLLLVWAADIGAYFIGRRWGQNKLAPSISPGKSVEGLIGGIVSVWCLAIVWLSLNKIFASMNDNIFSMLLRHGLVSMLIGLTFLTLMSAAGDLFESLIKRSAGKKDSSQLLPGHGGVLDRIDALLPVLPLSILLSMAQPI